MAHEASGSALLGALSADNAAFLDAEYQRFQHDPELVAPSLRELFAAWAAPTPLAAAQLGVTDVLMLGKQVGVLRLINAYRVRGHQAARLDPLDLQGSPYLPELNPREYGLEDSDLDTLFNVGSLAVTPERLPLRTILSLLQTVYCESLGAEYMHITDTVQKRWLQTRLEAEGQRVPLEATQQRWLLKLLCAAESLEHYLHARYPGQKRFSLEGAESLLPLLDELIQRAGAQGIQEIVLGMAHRGRLNVLVNILGKSPKELFAEFEGGYADLPAHFSGDVKYHQGFSCDLPTPGGAAHVALAFNPSHLEIVGPVVQGSVRARQERHATLAEGRRRVLAVQIHGDAAFAGQGVVMETLSMSQARGFTVGGSLHLIINNQIGFTTSNPKDARSSVYCTDVAKMVEAPIFHVNGDEPEQVIHALRLALDFCLSFHRDCVLDLVCYRRHGHNEADEPAVTQPLMYQRIRERTSVVQRYAATLLAAGVTAPDTLSRCATEYRAALEQGGAVARPPLQHLPNPYAAQWASYRGAHWTQAVATAVPAARLQALAGQLTLVPEGFVPHSRLAKVIEERRLMAAGELALDFGMAENLAYASLIAEGYPVRLSGQDSGRGTFFHRHAVWRDQRTGNAHIPLQALAAQAARFTVVDSLLSEMAVLAFEYGYSTANPRTLVIWEAQFGDFANGAQVVIDQFISSGEAKWARLCGLVLLLPHGYEGQGPEHSSARVERYLQLCAQHNLQVCMPSTAAQLFHLLRRQMHRPYRKPLVLFTHKSLLRQRSAASAWNEFTEGEFHPVLGETDPDVVPAEVRKVVLCSGKVYYELHQARQAQQIRDIALLRLEQCYPFPRTDLTRALQPYSQAQTLVWCQEEPRNQGAWQALRALLKAVAGRQRSLTYVGRPASASPAVGYYKLHTQQQIALIQQALT
jgi:2-oxoglutarate dehydrogenase E1 component